MLEVKKGRNRKEPGCRKSDTKSQQRSCRTNQRGSVRGRGVRQGKGSMGQLTKPEHRRCLLRLATSSNFSSVKKITKFFSAKKKKKRDCKPFRYNLLTRQTPQTSWYLTRSLASLFVNPISSPTYVCHRSILYSLLSSLPDSRHQALAQPHFSLSIILTVTPYKVLSFVVQRTKKTKCKVCQCPLVSVFVPLFLSCTQSTHPFIHSPIHSFKHRPQKKLA